jgi:hypothetical protein
MVPEEGHVVLEFHGRRVRLPVRVEGDLRFLASADQLTARDLPGSPDDQGRLVLVRSLVRQGFLTLVGGGDRCCAPRSMTTWRHS